MQCGEPHTAGQAPSRRATVRIVQPPMERVVARPVSPTGQQRAASAAPGWTAERSAYAAPVEAAREMQTDNCPNDAVIPPPIPTQGMFTGSITTSVCPHCGRQNQTGAVLCAECGKRIVSLGKTERRMVACPYCGAANVVGTQICVNCQQPLDGTHVVTKACPHCGAPNREHATICVACGENMLRQPKQEEEKKRCAFCGRTLVNSRYCVYCNKMQPSQDDSQGTNRKGYA